MIARTANATLLARLHAECFGEAWSAGSFEGLLANKGCFALADETQGAFILIQVVEDQSEILSLGVTPAARRRGIATHLLQWALNEAVQDGAISMFLEVDCRNYPAIALYKKLGFVEMGRRKGYYATEEGPRSDALTLRTEIRALLVGNRVQLG